jgi:hypothetical protein
LEHTDIQYFILLKSLIQDKFLERNAPSNPQIAKWKGIDIIYFIEDLRKIARASISEKSFYTYFKNENLEKLPRIDTLNVLSIYCGYSSWHHYKQENTQKLANMAVAMPQDIETGAPSITNLANEKSPESITKESSATASVSEPLGQNPSKPDLQTNENQILDTEIAVKQPKPAPNLSAWFNTSAFKLSGMALLLMLLVAGVYQFFFADKQYQYCFIDSDRNKLVDNKLEIKIIRENESPILYRVNANECFKYTTGEQKLKMIINSPFYKTDTIYRNLKNAPAQESIELKPNDYAIMLYYFSKSIKDLKLKRMQLNKLISDDAQIYQVYDSEYYGLENIDKQKYISLVTLPSTSLEKLNVLETKMKNGKIVKIKFKIDQNDQP